MQILSYEQFINHPANKDHPKYKFIDDCTEYVTLHTGLALIQISDTIDKMETEEYSFLCPLLDDLVIDHLKYNCIWDQPDHNPAVLYNWIQKSLNLQPLNFTVYDTLSALIMKNKPLAEYFEEHNIPSGAHIFRLELLKHIQSIGIHNIEFEFLFIAKE